MAREKKSPGLKILWVWALGTAAILITSVVRMRLRETDRDNLMRTDQQQTPQHRSSPPDSLLIDEEVIREDVS